MAAYFQTTPLRSVVQNELYFRLYLHHTSRGPNRNQIGVVSANAPNRFGNIVVNDWAITDEPAPDAKIVARGQGHHVQSSIPGGDWHNTFTIVFEDEGLKGSTLQVMGTPVEKGEWAIVGGTGDFTMAQGVIFKAIHQSDDNGNIIQLDIHALYTPMKRSQASDPADGNAWTLGV